jgi:hypothetical protein
MDGRDLGGEIEFGLRQLKGMQWMKKLFKEPEEALRRLNWFGQANRRRSKRSGLTLWHLDREAC